MNRSQIRALLICGVLSSLLYTYTDILLGLSWPGYSFSSQAISELSAIGAPTRLSWIFMTFLFSPLVMAFGIGARKVAGKKRSLQTTGILLTIWGFLGFIWLLFPMHMRGYIGSTTDTMHLVMSAVTVILMTSFIGFGSNALGKKFRFYSIFTLITMLVFGIMVGQQAPRVAAQLPTPWMGIMERISVYSPMVWVLFLAISLLYSKAKK
jgi:hypothetical protein